MFILLLHLYSRWHHASPFSPVCTALKTKFYLFIIYFYTCYGGMGATAGSQTCNLLQSSLMP